MGRSRPEAASEINLPVTRGLGTMPQVRTKNGGQHIVPFPAPAVALLKPCPASAAGLRWFTTNGETMLSGLSHAEMSIAPDAYATIAACQKFDWKHDVCYNTMELQRPSWSPSPGSVSTGPDRLLKEGREEGLWGIKNPTPQKAHHHDRPLQEKDPCFQSCLK